MRYVREMSFEEAEESEASLETEAGNAVRIMSVHAAKGLEFPVVFVGGIGEARRKRSGTKGKNPMFFAEEDGTVHAEIPHNLEQKGLFGKEGFKSSIKGSALRSVLEAEDARQAEEYLRLFYVALTRATEHLVLCGAPPKKSRADEDAAQSWWRACERALAIPGPDRLPSETLFEGVRVRFDRASEAPAPPRPVSVSDGRVQNAAPDSGKAAAMAETIRKRLTPSPRGYAETLPLTVSEIVKAFETRSPEPAAPVEPGRAREGKGGAAYGDLYHTVMRHLEFARPAGPQVDRLLKSLVPGAETGFLDEFRRSVEEFLKHPDSAALREAARAEKPVYRELPFHLRISKDAETHAVIAGQADLLYSTGSGWFLLDYKTGLERASHAFQVELYACALGKLLGDPIAGAALYYSDRARFRPVALGRVRSGDFEKRLAELVRVLK